MSATPKFAHVVFQTGQPEEMRAWWCAVLDGHVVHADEHVSFITFDEEHHRVALTHPPFEHERKTPRTAAMHHVAYTFDTIDDLLERYVLLRDQGIVPVVSVAHGVTTSMYYRDPDGNMVEMQIDRFELADEATAYMNSAEFAADGVGPSFEAEAMLVARRAGASAEELSDRSWALRTPGPDPVPLLMGEVSAS